MLGAHWLAAGYESPALLELASLGAADLSPDPPLSRELIKGVDC
jgi:hypothetical protein